MRTLLSFLAPFQSVLGWLSLRLASTTSGAPLETPAVIAEEWSDDAVIEDAAPRSQKLLLSRDGVDDRAGLAAAWRDVAARAKQSIAQASRLSIDLVAHDSVPALIEAANHDALEAVRHAKVCFALARAIDGEASATIQTTTTLSALTGTTTTATTTLADLASECLRIAFDASASARINAKLSRRAVDPSLKACLEEIAAIEARQSIHAFAVVAWCVKQQSRQRRKTAPIIRTIEAELNRLLAHTNRRSLPSIALEGGWERWGIAGASLENQEIENARTAITRRVADLALGRVKNQLVVTQAA